MTLSPLWSWLLVLAIAVASVVIAPRVATWLLRSKGER